MSNKQTVSINKEYAFWAGAILLQILLMAYLQGWFTSQSVQPPPAGMLSMSPAEARLVRGAIDNLLGELDKYTDYEDEDGNVVTAGARAREAFSASLPSTVRDKVLEVLGTPDIAFFRDALDILEGKLP